MSARKGDPDDRPRRVRGCGAWQRWPCHAPTGAARCRSPEPRRRRPPASVAGQQAPHGARRRTRLARVRWERISSCMIILQPTRILHDLPPDFGRLATCGPWCTAPPGSEPSHRRAPSPLPNNRLHVWPSTCSNSGSRAEAFGFCPAADEEPLAQSQRAKWAHARRAVVEPAGLLSVKKRAERICIYFHCSAEPFLSLHEKVS